MKKSQIEVGKFYKNHLFVREIIGKDELFIIYRDYSLNGRPISVNSKCRYATFVAWADRECTTKEIDCLKKNKMEEKTKKRIDEIRDIVEMVAEKYDRTINIDQTVAQILHSI